MSDSYIWDARTYDESFRFVSDHGEDLVRLLNPQPDERILDLGCGTGQLAARIAESGAKVVGLDRDVAMLESARQQFPKIEFVLGDGESLKIDGLFDAVFSNAALHWMTRPGEVLQGLRGLLRSGGRLVAELGGQGNIAIIEGAIRDTLEEEGIPRERQPQPWFFPSILEYSALLERYNLEPRMMTLFHRPTPLEEGRGGLAAWLRMFGRPLLEALPEDRIEAVVTQVEGLTRGQLWRGGMWVADYRRLRVVAVAYE